MKLPLNLVFWWTACLCLFFMPSMGGADTSLQINIYGPGQSKINTYLAPARLIAQQEGETLVPSRVQDLERVLYEDLGFLPFVHFVPGGVAGWT